MPLDCISNVSMNICLNQAVCFIELVCVTWTQNEVIVVTLALCVLTGDSPVGLANCTGRQKARISTEVISDLYKNYEK